MKKLMLLVAAAILFFTGTGYAEFISDNYLHPLDAQPGSRDLDLIGPTPPFDITGSEWISPTSLAIYTDWDLGLDGEYSPWYWKVQLGDVFLYTDSGTYAVALRDHTIENNFNVADTIMAGQIFAVTADTTYASDWYYGLAEGKIVKVDTTHYGDNEIVAAYGDPTGSNAGLAYGINNSGNPGSHVITLTFADDTFANSALRFAMTCANDVVYVPEPATLLLLGLGFMGVGVCGWRQRRKTM